MGGRNTCYQRDNEDMLCKQVKRNEGGIPSQCSVQKEYIYKEALVL